MISGDVVPVLEDGSSRYRGIDDVRRERGRMLVMGAFTAALSSDKMGVVVGVVRVDIEVYSITAKVGS